MGGKYTKPASDQGRRLGTSKFNCLSRPRTVKGTSGMRQSASCDANITFFSRVRSRLTGSGPRPKSALVEESHEEDAAAHESMVPRSKTDQNLVQIDDDQMLQDELLNDVREKLLKIHDHNDDDDEMRPDYPSNDVDDGDMYENQWMESVIKGDFERVGRFAKSPAIYNIKDVADEDADDLQLSLSPNSTLSDAEASISSSITPSTATPQTQPSTPPPVPFPPEPIQTQPSVTKKPSFLDRLTRRFLYYHRSKSSRATANIITSPTATTAAVPATATHLPASNKSTPLPSTRLSLSDGLIYIDDDVTLSDNMDLFIPAKVPPRSYFLQHRRSYFVELERTSVAMEQRCLRDNDTLSFNTISYVVASAPLAQSENSTLASSRDQLIVAPAPRRLRNSFSLDDSSISFSR